VSGLAAAGTNGQHSGNIMRDVKTYLGLPNGAPEFVWLEIPMKAGRKIPHPFLMPHAWFNSLYGQTERWSKAMVSSGQQCKSFWEGMRSTAFVKNHPRLMHADAWDSMVPLGIHADAGAFSNEDSLYVISFNSLLGMGPTISKRFLFTVVRKSEMAADTLDYILWIMSWSFNVLLDGESPATDYMGRELLRGGRLLAGGWKGCLAQVRGDWSFYCEAFYFPQWNCAVRKDAIEPFQVL
jgi:hypothetical protein